MNAIRRCWGLALLATLTACGATDGTEWEDTEAAWEPLSESTCLTAPSDAELRIIQFLGAYQSPTTVSPTTYSNPKCSKSWVAWVSTLYSRGDIQAQWTDTHPRTRAQCEGGSLTVRLMSRTTQQPIPVFYRNEGTFSAPLRFGPGQNSDVCWYPRFILDGFGGINFYYDPRFIGEPGHTPFEPLNFGSMNLIGRSVKVAAQALTPAGSTQSVTVFATLID